jgi:hypothetical protein
MIPAVSGYTSQIICIANSPDELNNFVPLEQSTPDYSRLLVQIPLDPSADISNVAQQIQATCEATGLLSWPEYQGTFSFIDGSTVYVAYLKPSSYGSVTPLQLQLIMIIGGILLIAPILLLIFSDTFRTIINSLVMMLVMYMMMKIMTPMIASAGGNPKVAAAPREPKIPIEQRVSQRIESIAQSVDRTEQSFQKSRAAGVSAVSTVISDIASLVRAIKGAPSTAMSSYEKAKAAREIDEIDDKLMKYKGQLSSSQLDKLNEEQSLVDELRTMYD